MTEKEASASAFGPGRLYLSALSEPTEANATERILGVTITTRERDREGDVVEPSGLDFSHFLQNPVVLWAHDLASAPIGRVLSIRILDERADAVVQFADTEAGRETYRLYAGRYLNAWSIGFIPKEWGRLPEDAEGRRGYHITAAEVVELSAVPVPANPHALTRDLKSGRLSLSPSLERDLLEEIPLRRPAPVPKASSPGEKLSPEETFSSEETFSPEETAGGEGGFGSLGDVASAASAPEAETIFDDPPERDAAPVPAEEAGPAMRPWRAMPAAKALDAAYALTRELARRELLRAAALARGELL
ncbi:MAG: HK97 family phage prohead protease [Planctomycetota bacterium]